MKNLSFYMLLVVAVLTSCKKDGLENYQVEKAHPNAEEMLAEFTRTLHSGSLAWQAVLNPKAGKSYTMFFKMDKGGNVWTLLDLNFTTARAPKSGTYRLGSNANNASIHFSSGTYLDDVTHKDGYRTVGADTSYSFKYMHGDTVILSGNQYGDELRLISITTEEELHFERGILGNAFIYLYDFFIQKPYFSVSIPDLGPVQIVIDVANRGIIFFYGKDGELVYASTDYSYGVNKILLKTPIRIGPYLFYELSVDTVTGAFYVAGGNKRFDLNGANMPVIPLHLLLGNEYPPYVSLPSPEYIEPLPGWSDTFKNIWQQSADSLRNSEFQASLLVFSFGMDIQKKTMDIEVFFAIDNATYRGVFPYKYTRTNNGVYKFEALPLDVQNNQLHLNASIIQPHLKSLLNMVRDNSFTMNLYDYGGTSFLAQMTSVEHPDIYFTGYMTQYYIP